MEKMGKDEVLKLGEEAYKTKFKLVRGKQILYEGIKDDGTKILLCTPEAGFSDYKKAWWFDLTMVQFELMEMYDKGVIVVRLEGRVLSLFSWEQIKPYLTEESMTINKSGGHWKIFIYSDEIEIQGNPNRFYNKVLDTREMII